MLKSTRNPLFINPFFPPAFKPFEKYFNYMISFSPVAPFFGVPWVFERMLDSGELSEKTAVAKNTKTAAAKKDIKAVVVKNNVETDDSFSSNKPQNTQQKKAKKTAEKTPVESEASVSSLKKTSAKNSAEQEVVPPKSIANADTQTAQVKASPQTESVSTDKTSQDVLAFDFEKTRSGIASAINPVSNGTNVKTTASSDSSKPTNLLESAPKQTDDLKLIKGVGPKLEVLLNKLGIYKFEQLVNYTPKELQWIDDNLTAFKGRALRDNWSEQARDLTTT